MNSAEQQAKCLLTVEPAEVESLEQLKVTWKCLCPVGASDWIALYEETYVCEWSRRGSTQDSALTFG